MSARAQAGWRRHLPGLQQDFVVERALESDESPARARGRTGAWKIQRVGVPRDAHRLSRNPSCRGALSGEVAPPWRLEGFRVQHDLRRDVQRPPSRPRQALRLASVGFLSQMKLIKAHALGNDFLRAAADQLPPKAERATLARAVCQRHRGIGADGRMFYTLTGSGAAMELLNADGSYSEVSGNGVRCLAAWIAFASSRTSAEIEIATDAGVKRLTLLERSGSRYTFRAFMGEATNISRVSLDAAGERVDAVTLRVGNPQGVVL